MDIYEVTPNYSPEERKAMMKEVLQREQDPEYQRALAQVDEHLAALQDAEEKLERRKRGLEVVPETGDVEKIEKAEHAVSAAEITVTEADEALKRLRGDYLDEPASDTAKPAPVATASDAQLIRKNQRPDLLTPLIEKAQRGESDPFNAAVIWPKLCDMAEQKVKPFIGKTGDGLQWIDANDDPKFLSKEALGDRLRRAKKAAIELAKPR